MSEPAAFTKATLDAIISGILPMSQPRFIMVSSEHHAVMQAAVAFAGRDRRRIKREIRKASNLARIAARGKPKVADTDWFGWTANPPGTP